MKAIIGIGVPGCGKTTYLKPLSERLGFEYINADDIRYELTGDPTNHTQELLVWKTVHDRLFGALGRNGAVVDATFTKPRDRRKVIEICRAKKAEEIIAYWFDVPLRTCKSRNRNRERKVPDEAIDRMYNRLKLNPPALSEGFTEIIKISN